MVTRKRIKTIFQIRRALQSEWEEINPVLWLAEPGYAYDTRVLKIGDGVHHWNELDLANQQEFDEIISRIDHLRVIDLVDGADYATKEYVDENGGKINTISVNGEPQQIDQNKNVDISIPVYSAGNGIVINNQNQISLEQNLIIDCGTSTTVL